MDFSLNHKQLELIKMVRMLINEEMKRYNNQPYLSLEPDFDKGLTQKIGEHNLLCPTIPQEYGGQGLDMFTTLLILEEISTVSRSLATQIGVNVFAIQPVLIAGTDEQKKRFLPLFTGKNVAGGALALTESTGGSDVKSMNTFAVKEQESYIINGSKNYIFNAPDADIITLFAKTNLPGKRSSMLCFIIPQNTNGVQINIIPSLSGSKTARMGEIIFDNTKVDISTVIKPNEPYSGKLLLNQTLDIGRALTAVNGIGIARAAYELAREYANERIQFGQEIKKHQAVAHTLVDMATKIEMARLLTWKAAWLIDNGEDFTITSAMAKVSASTMAQEVTVMAAEILASKAFVKDSLMEELLRDAMLRSTMNGTKNINRNIIASLLL